MDVFSCLACETPLARPSPLCPHCEGSLFPCPELCSQCFHLPCRGSPCEHPWISKKPLQTLTVEYLQMGAGHRVLKAWKRTLSPILNQRLLQFSPRTIQRLQKLSIQGLVPIPHSARRRWELHGSPPQKVAQQLSHDLGIPIYRLLKIRPAKISQGPQDRLDRLTHPHPFQIQGALPSAKNLLLVDDLSTTGQTLLEAARTLDVGNRFRLHAFCLGLRTRRTPELENLSGRITPTKRIT